MSVELIKRVYPHTNADTLELVQVLGYQCIVPKDKYKEGDKIVFIQPDYVLPDLPWAADYKKYVKNRIKAIKIRGEWSEGIILPLQEDKEIGTDVKDELQIVKYSVPESNEGNTKPFLPFSIPKTDEPRWESLREIPFGEFVDVSLKIDGQSWSMFYHLPTEQFGIASRSITFTEEDRNDYTSHLQRYPNLKQKLIEICQQNGKSLCIRGESFGQGIQNMKHNPHCKLEKGLKLFSVYIIDEHRYAGKGDPLYFATLFPEMAIDILEQNVVLTRELIDKYSLTTDFGYEGVVMKGKDFSFKVINKHYDSKK